MLEIGRGLHDDAILIGLRIDRRNDALAEGVVKHIVDRRQRDPEAAGGGPIDHQIDGAALVLHIARDVGEFGQVLQFADERGVQVCSSAGAGILKNEMILGAADARIDRQILHRLHIELDAFDARRFPAAAGG